MEDKRSTEEEIGRNALGAAHIGGKIALGVFGMGGLANELEKVEARTGYLPEWAQSSPETRQMDRGNYRFKRRRVRTVLPGEDEIQVRRLPSSGGALPRPSAEELISLALQALDTEDHEVTNEDLATAVQALQALRTRLRTGGASAPPAGEAGDASTPPPGETFGGEKP